MKKEELSRGVHRRFTGIIPGVRIRADKMLWPPHAAPIDGQYHGNGLYTDFRGKTWLRTERVLRFEQLMISRLEEICRARGAKRGIEVAALEHRACRMEPVLKELDLGTWAVVHAISAAGGVPLSSCSGGSFGGVHGEPFPVVCFCWPPSKLHLLRMCAKEAGVSAWHHHRGEVVIGADYIRRFLMFAQALLKRRHLIDALDCSSEGRR
jgi:hypothetical protein